MFFSVIIPVYNREGPLRRALDSVRASTEKDYEILLVDDGSDEPLERMVAEQYPMVKYIRKARGGVSSARNAGIRQAAGEYIAFLDSDDEWLPGKLRKQREFIERNQDVRISQCDEIWIRNGVRVNAMRKHKKEGGDIFARSLELCLVSPSAVVMRRDIFDEYGYFDETMPVCEDYDLWLRISCREAFGFIDEKLIIKNGGHEDQLSRSDWGFDRYRIYSMMKFLTGEYGALPEKNKKSLDEVLEKKINILLQGALKRENKDLLHNLTVLKAKISSGAPTNKDCLFLLQ